MPCLPLKRKAERGVPDERACKVLNIKGRRVVYDPDDDVAIKPACARGHAPAPNGRKRRREGDGNDGEGKLPKRAKAGEPAEGIQSMKPTRTQKKRPSPKTVAADRQPATTQQQRAAKPGLSFFETIQRKGVKPLPPQGSQVRTVLTPKLATPKKAQPLKPQAVSVKPQRRFLPNNSGPIRAPEGINIASTAALVSKTETGIETPAHAKDASTGSPKRKAEEHVEGPSTKKPAVGKTKTLSWLQTGKLAPTATYKRYFKKDVTVTTKASRSEARKNGNQKDVKTAGSDTSRAINGSDDRAEKVPSLENNGNCCFANSMLQALHSIPEIRDHFTSKVRNHANAALDQSLGLSLGRLFRKMQTVVRDGGKESARDFLQAFGSRHREYDGSKQQDAYEFLEKLFRELEAEETGSGGLASNDVSLLKELFAGQTVTRLECSSCGKKRDTASVDACWSIRLNVPQEGRETTISDCLRRAVDAETPEGYACESCGKKDVTSKRERLKSWGKYLLLNCDRAVRRGVKVGTKIPIPRYVNLDEHMLDYQPSTSDVGRKMANLFPEFQYEVVAFAEHNGATRNGGHYTATIRKSDKEWFRCDDEKVSRVEREKDLQATTATVIILKRC
ncbi:MAG: hypothetical protein Q9225_005760 [Loekoesia sp. 1 TL-2023]